MPVGGHEVVEVMHPQERVDDTGEDDETEGDECDRRIPLDDRLEVLRGCQPCAQQCDDEESTEPEGRTEDVQAEAVDGLSVPGGLRGVAHQCQGEDHGDTEHSSGGDADMGAGTEAQGGGDGDEDDDEHPQLPVGDLSDEDAELVREVEVGLSADGVDEGEDEHGDR